MGCAISPIASSRLQAAIRWSYDLLTPAARQAALRHASVFRGGFTAAALEAVTDSPVRAEINELREANLVRRQARTVRAAGARAGLRSDYWTRRGRAGAAASPRPFAGRHSGDRRLTRAAPGELAASLLADHANLREAAEDAIEAGDESAVWPSLSAPSDVAGRDAAPGGPGARRRLLDRFEIPGDREVALVRAVAYLDYSPTAKIWHRRLAAVAARIGDHEALAVATGNLFGQALNARDTEEMRQLRPGLLALLTPEASARSRGWDQLLPRARRLCGRDARRSVRARDAQRRVGSARSATR